MQKGKLRKLRGAVCSSKAVIKIDKFNQFKLVTSNGRIIQLSNNIAQVTYQSKDSISVSKLAARSTVGAIAGGAWKSGHGATSGFFASVAESVNVSNEEYALEMVLLDGRRIRCRANFSAVNILGDLSAQLSHDELNQLLMRNQITHMRSLLEAQQAGGPPSRSISVPTGKEDVKTVWYYLNKLIVFIVQLGLLGLFVTFLVTQWSHSSRQDSFQKGGSASVSSPPVPAASSPTFSESNGCGEPFPCQLDAIIDRTDWESVKSALVFATKRNIKEKVKWSGKANGHNGYILSNGQVDNTSHCGGFEVVSFMGPDTGTKTVTTCRKDDGTIEIK